MAAVSCPLCARITVTRIMQSSDMACCPVQAPETSKYVAEAEIDALVRSDDEPACSPTSTDEGSDDLSAPSPFSVVTGGGRFGGISLKLPSIRIKTGKKAAAAGDKGAVRKLSAAASGKGSAKPPRCQPSLNRGSMGSAANIAVAASLQRRSMGGPLPPRAASSLSRQLSAELSGARMASGLPGSGFGCAADYALAARRQSSTDFAAQMQALDDAVFDAAQEAIDRARLPRLSGCAF